MARLRRTDSFEDVRHCGLFRAAHASQVLVGQGAIFDHGLKGMMPAAGMGFARIPTREQVQQAGTVLFNGTSQVEKVDVFVSHTWNGDPWAKYLGLCLYLNLGWAVGSSLVAWLLAIGSLVAAGGVQGLGGSRLLFPSFVCFPAAIFFLMLFRGHDLSCGWSSPTIWLDKLCIHQTDENLKKQQLLALPVFVSRSSRMLVLWDETYFERLWCQVELATFIRRGDQHGLDFQPLWLAPWLVNCICLELLSAVVAELCEILSPTASNTGEVRDMFSGIFGDTRRTITFCVYCFEWLVSSAIIYLPMMIPCFYSFWRKLQQHEHMLLQMANFNIREAKCSLMHDRVLLEQQVEEMLGNTHHTPAELVTINVDEPNSDSAAAAHDHGVDQPMTHVVMPRELGGSRDALDSFNAYVRGPLHDVVLAQIGTEHYVPWHFCMVALLPDVFYSAVNILGCDNGLCQKSASEAGFTSVAQYMVTQALAWLVCLLFSIPLAYPILLRMIKLTIKISNGPLQSLVVMLCCPVAYAVSNTCSGIVWGCLYLLAMDYSPVWFAGFLMFLSGLVLTFFLHFLKHESQTVSCRCLTRQVDPSVPLMPERACLL